MKFLSGEYQMSQRSFLRAKGYFNPPAYDPKHDAELRYLVGLTDVLPESIPPRWAGKIPQDEVGIYVAHLLRFNSHKGAETTMRDLLWAISGAENTKDEKLRQLFLSVISARLARGRRLPFGVSDRVSKLCLTPTQ